MNCLLQLLFLGSIGSAHDGFVPPIKTGPSAPSLLHAGRVIKLSPKEYELTTLIKAAPGGVVTYGHVYAWAGWSGGLNVPRVRTFLRFINMKALADSGSPLFLLDRPGAEVRAFAPAPAPVRPDLDRYVAKVCSWQLPLTTDTLFVTYQQYAHLGLPRDEIVRMVRALDPEGRVARVNFQLMHYHSTVVTASKKPAYWYPRGGSSPCEPSFVSSTPVTRP